MNIRIQRNLNLNNFDTKYLLLPQYGLKPPTKKDFHAAFETSQQVFETWKELMSLSSFGGNIEKLKDPFSPQTKSFIKVIWEFIDVLFNKFHMSWDDMKKGFKKHDIRGIDKETRERLIDRAVNLFKIGGLGGMA